MEIQVLCSDAVRDKIRKKIKNTSVEIVEDSKLVLVERGYELAKGKIAVVFDPIDYDEALDVILEGSNAVVDEGMEGSITGFSNNRYSVIRIDEIYYMEAGGSQVTCFTADGEYSVKNTLSHYEKTLGNGEITRINKSQIVNMRNVKEIVPWFNSRLVFILENGREVEVSKLYSKSIRKMLNI